MAVLAAGVGLALAGGVAGGLGGCSGSKKKGATAATPVPSRAPAASGAVASDDPASLYRAGRYASAFEAAKARVGRSQGAEKERMQLVAGLSAAALDRNTDALLYLRPLTGSADEEIAGRASAGVGLIDAEEGRHSSAVPNLKAAAAKLSGDEAAKAWFYLGESYSATGASAEATSAYRQASGVATDRKLKRLADERLNLNAFTIQVASFRDAGKARQAAGSAAGRARAAGLPPPRVVTKSLPDGRSVFAVQIGTYRELARAQADRTRLGGDAVVTRTAG
ncbi:MAG: SPOR domain-containing protein [Phycisphaerales bacterium]